MMAQVRSSHTRTSSFIVITIQINKYFSGLAASAIEYFTINKHNLPDTPGLSPWRLLCCSLTPPTPGPQHSCETRDSSSGTASLTFTHSLQKTVAGTLFKNSDTMFPQYFSVPWQKEYPPPVLHRGKQLWEWRTGYTRKIHSYIPIFYV